ncbi:unnamed protein product [Ascophyllum nodosum]
MSKAARTSGRGKTRSRRGSTIENPLMERMDVISDVIALCPKAFLFIAGVSKSWKKAWLAGGRCKETSVKLPANTQAMTEWVLDDETFHAAAEKHEGLLCLTVVTGNLGAFQAVTRKMGQAWFCRPSRRAAELAAEFGHLELLKWARARGCCWGMDMCARAAEYGELEMLKWLRAEKCHWDSTTCLEAAAEGHLEVLKWAREQKCPWGAAVCARAAWNGQLEVLKWLRAEGCPWNSSTCHDAAEGGHLEVLQWARDQGCRWNAKTCTAAARSGHIDVLKWARGQRCPWGRETCLVASLGGYSEILMWLRAQGCPWNRDECATAAMQNGHMALAQWVQAQG